MFIADGGGSASSPTATGPQTLKVDPPAIPGARDAFYEAAEKIEALVQRLNSISTPPWANDPVSKTTADRFDNGTADMGTNAAINALTKYGVELRNTGDALNEAYKEYVRVEGTNTEKWKGQAIEA
ncbi:hypothetical protein JOF56_002490 [Kibdelosporangium banguiense]|uniref:PE domain-containing protein n=1 Tax=Kibdelosporangium banguiense TaxID=1365924 RepID=A0ABS4TCF0_9PSEU|nr:hypothetical protein [Kibdelosporangium banguiense]MBP2322105.1 hypothetical protein [Kibdelosporangium banguiense]